MKTVGKYLTLLLVSFLLLVYLIHGGLTLQDFKAAFIGIRSGHSLNSIPTTFRGSLDVISQERSTRSLSDALIALAEKYGMNPASGISGDGVRWQVQIYCQGNFVGNVTTLGNGELILFQTSPYGFKESSDYESFNLEMVNILKRYGAVRNLERFAPLARDELLARGEYMKMNVTSQCSPAGK
ncbi:MULTISPECIES: hypothetical protein [unclassified Duganella]|uniref:hypothetical protein n=1 Tax=unclassified Duganella TaxID=2636909 RepID=UPI000A48345D|nr:MULTISPECIES: hypothetical protein [unclassified Duganella]